MDPVQLGLTASVAQWDEFFVRLGPTDEAESLESTGEINTIFVVSKFLFERRKPEFKLYCIDLSSAHKDGEDSVQPLKPLLQFDVSSGSRIYHEFVVLGSRLFMFGQWDGDAVRWTSDWCFYDFSRALYSPTTNTVKERDFVRGHQMMSSRKFHPVAAVVDSYRICVFATRLHDLNWRDEMYAGVYESPSFEVLDTREMSWIQLPEPIFTSSEQELERIEITSYYIERSCLIICTYVGMYGINIDAVNPKWEIMEGMKRVNGDLFLGRWTVVGKNMCYPFEVVRWGELKPYPFAEPRLVTDEGYGAMCLKRDGGSIVLCRVQSSFVPDGYTRALLVKIFKLSDESVENFRGDMWETIECEKSAYYALETRKCNRVKIMGCFEFKEAGKESGSKDKATEDDRRRPVVVDKKSIISKRAGERKRESYSGERRLWR